MVEDILERLNDWHIDIIKHNVEWGRLVVDVLEEIETLLLENRQLKQSNRNKLNMPKPTLEEVTTRHCNNCGQMVGQTTKTRAWLYTLPEPCELCHLAANTLLLNIQNRGLTMPKQNGPEQQ